MKTILITNAGRGAAINFCRSLKLVDEEFKIIGIDQSKYSLINADVDEKILCPDGDSDEYIPFIINLVENKGIDLLYASKTNSELLKISRNRHLIKAETFLPDQRTLELCEDKFQTNQILRAHDIEVPDTILITNRSELDKFMKKYPEEIDVIYAESEAELWDMDTKEDYDRMCNSKEGNLWKKY